ncbi:hypothetical protein [Compostibacter hankyongensis]|uniref:hypothetical protein n=1 Tax=Compostibacter hankyongensis TaxID=1007089 RepID=UPI003CD0616B
MKAQSTALSTGMISACLSAGQERPVSGPLLSRQGTPWKYDRKDREKKPLCLPDHEKKCGPQEPHEFYFNHLIKKFV